MSPQGRFTRFAPAAAILLSACSTTQVLQLPETLDAASREIDAAGPATHLVVHSRDTSDDEDVAAVRDAESRAGVEALLRYTTPREIERDQPFADSFGSLDVPWTDVVMISHRTINTGSALVKGLGLGALLGAVIGAAVFAPKGDTSLCGRSCTGTAGGALFGLLGGLAGAVIGSASGDTRTIVWRR